MSALTLNGIVLPVALDQLSRLEPELIGEMGRGFSGAELANVRAWKEGWKAKATPQTAATAAALRGLVKGDGYSWSFDTAAGLYADRKGLGPSTASAATVGGSGKYGQFCTVGATGTLQYAISGSATKWALLYWKLNNLVDAIWEHFIVLGDGSKYKNGATTTAETWTTYNGSTLRFFPADAIYSSWQDLHAYTAGDFVVAGDGPWIFRAGATATSSGEPDWNSAPSQEDTVTSGDGITWTNYGLADAQFDDVLFLPYAIPTSWVSQLYAEASARAWTALPRLRLAGDAAAGLANGYATVTGKLTGDAPLRRRALSGAGAVTNAEELELELREA